MAVTGISYTGQINGTGVGNTYAADNAMFLKVFSGEVLQAFETATVMKPLHTIRTISNGKSAQFPLTGIATAAYHTPGEDLLTDGSYVSAIKHAEKIISIDDLLTATTFIDKLDEAKNHYDVRSIYSTELGRALAKEMDKHLIGTAINTAVSLAGAVPSARANAVTGLPGSTLITNAFYNSVGPDIPDTDNAKAAFINNMFQMAAAFDANNVPSEDRYVVLTPQSYYRIVNSDSGKDLINRDYNPDPSNSFVNAQIASIAGFRMIRSNIAAQVYGSTVTASGTQNSYGGDFSRIKAIAFQKQAFGTVKLLDLAMESEYEIRLQGHLMVAKYAMGHGALRHECAGVLAETA